MGNNNSTPPKVFIVYSQADKEYMSRVRKNLDSLSYAGKLSAWADVCLDAGSDWKAEIKAALKSADAAVLLVSPDFLGTPFIQDVEIPELLERHVSEKMPIVPVLVRPSNWEHFDWLYRLMSYCKQPKPLAMMEFPEVDEAIKALCNQLIRTLASDRPWSARDASIGTRLRVLCAFPRPIASGTPIGEQICTDLDLRTEWAQLVTAINLRKTPVALLRLRPPTKERLLDELMALADAGNYPHVVHLSAHQCSEGLIFEDEMGQAQHVPYDELLRDLSSTGHTLPLLVCRLPAGKEHASLQPDAFQDSRINNIVTSLADLDLGREAKSWADLYSRLARRGDIVSAFEFAFPPDVAKFQRKSPGPLLEESLEATTSYINEGVNVRSFPLGSSHFVGRSKELVKIARQMSSTRVTLITGMTGLGGKSLALEATYRNAWRFPGRIAIFDAEHQQGDGEELTEEAIIARLAEELDVDRQLGIESVSKADRLTQIRHLMEEGDYLFVFLCMEIYLEKNPSSLEKLLDLFINHGHGCHCIIETKQSIQLASRFPLELINRIQMEPLSEEESCRLTKLLAQDDPATSYIATDENKTRTLASLSEGYPKILAMALALSSHYVPYKDVIDELSNHKGQIGLQIDGLLDRAVNRLDVDAKKLLQCLQLFPARSISSISLNTIRDALQLTDIKPAICALVDTNLIHLDTNVQRYYWDKIVHDHACALTLDAPLQQAVDRELIRTYSGKSAFADADRLRDVLTQGESAVNILAVVTRTMKPEKNEPNGKGMPDQTDLRNIAYDIARQAHRRGLEFEGRSLLSSVMHMCRQSSDPSVQGDQAETAALLYDMASVEQAQGEHPEAEKHYLMSLKINEDGEDRYGKARSLHGLGRLHHDLGDFTKARNYYEASLRLRKEGKKSGDKRENNNTIAQLHHELARLAHDEGRFLEAKRLHEDTLSMREHSEARDERGLAATKYELGRLAQDTGDWEQAEHWYMQSVHHWQEGRYWIGVGIVQHALASLSALRCKADEAYESFSNCLEIQRRSGDKRGVATTLAQLGMLELGNPKKAESFLKESEQMQQEASYVRGEMVAKIGYAMLKKTQNRLGEAEKILWDVRRHCKELSDKKLSARVDLLLGSLKLAKSEKTALKKADRDQAFDSLMSALQTSLRIGDKCTEAVAKVRLGQLMGSVFDVDTDLEEDGFRTMKKLHGQDIDKKENACNVMATLC